MATITQNTIISVLVKNPEDGKSHAEAYSELSAIHSYLEPTERFPSLVFLHEGENGGSSYYWFLTRQVISEAMNHEIECLRYAKVPVPQNLRRLNIPLFPCP